MSNQPDTSAKKELSAFLLLTAVIAPVTAVTIVVSYGFIVWISQILGGPPGS